MSFLKVNGPQSLSGHLGSKHTLGVGEPNAMKVPHKGLAGINRPPSPDLVDWTSRGTSVVRERERETASILTGGRFLAG